MIPLSYCNFTYILIITIQNKAQHDLVTLLGSTFVFLIFYGVLLLLLTFPVFIDSTDLCLSAKATFYDVKSISIVLTST